MTRVKAFWIMVCLLGSALLSSVWAAVPFIYCDEFYSTSFENGALEPYWECTFKRPAYIDPINLDGNMAAEAWWSAEDYDGTRLDRGMEACSGNFEEELRFTEDGWYGLKIRVPSEGYAMNKNCIVLQIFAHGRGGSWAGHLSIRDNKLFVEHRAWLTTNTEVYELDADIERDTWIPIIIHFKPSTNAAIGKVQVWYDGAPEHDPSYDYTGKFAFDGIDTTGDGEYDDSGWVDEDTMKSGIGLKWGMYCADTDYDLNEERTLYYDDVTQLKGDPVGAWDLVNPQADGRDAFSRIDVEYYSDQSGTVTTNCTEPDGGFKLVDLQNGDWVAFYDVNFDTGATGFQARVASDTLGGSIEVRLGSTNGTLLAACPVSNTGGNWLTETFSMAAVSGKQDVYLKFTGGGGDLLALNWFRAVKTAPDEFFSNDLIDAGIVARDFNEKLPASGNGVWSYTNDYALAQDGTTNTVLQGGAVVSYVSTDTDTARSYLATVHSNYAGKSWTARVAVETVNTGSKNTIFFGLGNGVPNASDSYKPTSGDHVYVSWESGNSGSAVSVYRNGVLAYNTGSWQGDPGYDIYMTYNAADQTVFFEVDNWADGRDSGVDVTTGAVSTDGFLTDTNSMNIFFGGNGTMTFGDFEVIEPNASATPQNLYSAQFDPLEITLGWDAVSDADAYNVYRSLGGGSGYEQIASGVTATNYLDTAVTANELYYYAVTGTNDYGESVQSANAQMVALPYELIGPASSYSTLVGQQDNLFDGDSDTFYDTTVNNSWVGWDFGVGNEQQIYGARYTLRDWTSAKDRTIGAVIQGANNSGFFGAVTLYTVPTNVLEWADSNEVTISDTGTYRYVRMLAQSGRPLYGLSELWFSIEPGPPSAPTNFYAWPDSNNVVTVRWDADALATSGFTIYRSTNDTDYVEIASGVMDNGYVDSDVTTGETFFYKAAGVNTEGEGDFSASEFAVPTPYFIVGSDATDVLESKYELFDGDTGTIFDRDASGFAGIDFGAANAQVFSTIRYFLRNDSWGNLNGGTRSITRSVGFTFQGANAEDFSDAVVLYTLPTNSLMAVWNEVTLTNTASFRYIRLQSGGDFNDMNIMAELEFIGSGFTASGTPYSWLLQYDLDGTDDLLDSDQDGLLTWEEYIAGTDPTNSASVLQVHSIRSSASGIVVTWQSVAGKSYSIITNANLTAPNPDVAVSNITGQANSTSYPVPVGDEPTLFFKVGVQ
jgi:hypothetical protein